MKQRADLSEILDLGQRDFEIAVRHTKNLIRKEKLQKEEQAHYATDETFDQNFLSTDENSMMMLTKGIEQPLGEYKDE